MSCRKLIALFLIVSSGCSFRETVPELQGPLIPTAHVTEVMNNFDTHRRSVSDIKALIRTKIVHGDETESYRYAVIYRRPDALRVEVFPLNSFYTLSLLAVLREKLVSLDTTSSIAYEGNPSRDAIERAFGFPLNIEEIASLLLAEIPAGHGEFSGVISETGTEKYLSADRQIYFEKDPQETTMRLLKIYDDDKKLIIEVHFRFYRKIDDIEIPEKLEIQLPQYDVTGAMNATNISINSGPADSLFAVQPPGGFEIKSIN